MLNTQTSVVAYDSPLVRKKWLKEGMIQKASTSFWSQYTGMGNNNIVVQKNDISKSDGHEITFDLRGNIAGRAIKGKDAATGKGEAKRKFSDSIRVERYRIPVDNGDVFDGVNVGDLRSSQHSDSRDLLADLFVRFKDQAIFDVAQGFHKSSTSSTKPTHTIQYDCSTTLFSYDHITDIDQILRTGTGYKTGDFGSSTDAGQRAPLQPYMMQDGRKIWLCVVDTFMATNIKKNLTTKGIFQLATTADIRGNDNRVFKGLIGKVGSLMFVESDIFFGESDNRDFNGSSIEIAGMRNYDSDVEKWTGEEGFLKADYSRCLILGQRGIMIAFGRQPDYKWQASLDFQINSESAVEFWMDAQKINYKAEHEDYKQAKVANMDYGMIALDIKIA